MGEETNLLLLHTIGRGCWATFWATVTADLLLVFLLLFNGQFAAGFITF